MVYASIAITYVVSACVLSFAKTKILNFFLIFSATY